MINNVLAKSCQRILSLASFLAIGISASAADIFSIPEEGFFDDATYHALTASDSVAKKKNFVTKILDYFRNANKVKDFRKFDFGFLPGPHYSSTAGLGLGMVATGTYTLDKTDPQLPRSNVSLYSDITTKGFMLIGINGLNIFPKDKFRIEYRTYIYTFPTNFWGIGFDNADNDDNETEYRRIRVEAMTRFLFRVAKNTYIGPLFNFKFVKAQDIEEEGLYLFEGQHHSVHAQTAGISFTYDSRDFMLNAQKGWFVQLDQTFTPRFLGNDYCFSSTELTASTYDKLWKGAVLASEVHTLFNYGKPAWCLLSEVGTPKRMRGYYEGRYRDKNIMEAQVELRQHIKGRHGAVAWLGVAQVFPEFDEMRFKKILPNAGIGYRWEFKNRINVRLDCGFGKNGPGFLFNINEAF